MKRKQKLLRQELSPLETNPETGLRPDQVAARKEKGWANLQIATAGKTEGEIIAKNLLTFFNLVFVVLAAAAGIILKQLEVKKA